jgi:hypothetical protein
MLHSRPSKSLVFTEVVTVLHSFPPVGIPPPNPNPTPHLPFFSFPCIRPDFRGEHQVSVLSVASCWIFSRFRFTSPTY